MQFRNVGLSDLLKKSDELPNIDKYRLTEIILQSILSKSEQKYHESTLLNT